MMTGATGPCVSHHQKLAQASSNAGSHRVPKIAREDKSHCRSAGQPLLISQQPKQVM